MSPTQHAAIVALTRIAAGQSPVYAIADAADFVGGAIQPQDVADLLRPRVLRAVEAGAERYLAGAGMPDVGTVSRVGYDLASGWFPASDKRGDEYVPRDVADELVRPMVREWWDRFELRAVAA